MKTFKATAIIVLTLLIGILIGILAGGRISDRKLRAFIEYRTEKGFRRMSLEILDPDEEQAKELLPIINEYARLNRDLNQSYRHDLEALQLSYWSEIQPYLNEKQVNRLISTGSRGPGPGMAPPPGQTGPRHRAEDDSAGIHRPPQHHPQIFINDSAAAWDSTTARDTSAGSRMSLSQVGPPPEHFGPRHGEAPGQVPGPVVRAERHSLMLKQRLLLSEDQYQAVRKLNLDYAVRMKEVNDSYHENPRPGWLDDISALDGERNEKMKAVLTPEQYEQYEVLMKELKQVWLNKRRRR